MIQMPARISLSNPASGSVHLYVAPRTPLEQVFWAEVYYKYYLFREANPGRFEAPGFTVTDYLSVSCGEDVMRLASS